MLQPSDRQRRLITFLLDNLVWFILIFILILFSLTIDKYFQIGIFINILRQATFVGILSIGLSLVIIAGHLDLSIESVMAFAAMITAFLVASGGVTLALGINPWLTLPAALLLGAIVGWANGFLVVRLQISAFIVTLAAFIGIRGLGLMITGGRSVYGLPDPLRAVASTTVVGLPLMVLILISCYALFHFILTRTTFGRHLYLIGGNATATFRAGINVKRLTITVFMLSGALAGLAGWLLSIRTNGATPNLGSGMLFEAFAAVVIGGVSLQGGVGRLTGVIAGVLLLSSIDTAINVMGLPPQFMQVIRGLLVLFAVLLDSLKLQIHRRYL
ncbi:MAG: ABC transporter permease [Trueperaceae bacterium]|nr:MAG: ABC transporter permease [Trueperaceae bacterium]